MTADRTAAQRSLEADLVAWGKVIRIETRGRTSGLVRRATIGFLEDTGGALLVAAADDDAHWAQNLLANGVCRVEHAGLTTPRHARALSGDERRSVITRLILKYGTPAERQGNGPAFRLELTEAAART